MAETWALKKAHGITLEVAKKRTLRWMSGVTKLGQIINERIRGTTKVVEVATKVQERRLKLYVQFTRREEYYVGSRAIQMKLGAYKGERRDEGLRVDGWSE